MEDTIDEFRDLLRTTWDRGGNIIIRRLRSVALGNFFFHLTLSP